MIPGTAISRALCISQSTLHLHSCTFISHSSLSPLAIFPGMGTIPSSVFLSFCRHQHINLGNFLPSLSQILRPNSEPSSAHCIHSSDSLPSMFPSHFVLTGTGLDFSNVAMSRCDGTLFTNLHSSDDPSQQSADVSVNIRHSLFSNVSLPGSEPFHSTQRPLLSQRLDSSSIANCEDALQGSVLFHPNAASTVCLQNSSHFSDPLEVIANIKIAGIQDSAILPKFSPTSYDAPFITAKQGGLANISGLILCGDNTTPYNHPVLLIEMGGEFFLKKVVIQHFRSKTCMMEYPRKAGVTRTKFEVESCDFDGNPEGVETSLCTAVLGTADNLVIYLSNFTDCINTKPLGCGGAVGATLVAATSLFTINSCTFTNCQAIHRGSAVAVQYLVSTGLLGQLVGLAYSDCFNGDSAVPRCHLYLAGMYLETIIKSRPSYVPTDFNEPTESVGYDPLEVYPFYLSVVRGAMTAKTQKIGMLVDEETGRDMLYCGGSSQTDLSSGKQVVMMPCLSIISVANRRPVRKASTEAKEDMFLRLMSTAHIKDAVDLTDGDHKIMSDTVFTKGTQKVAIQRNGKLQTRAHRVWMATSITFQDLVIDVTDSYGRESVIDCEITNLVFVSVRVEGRSPLSPIQNGLISIAGGSIDMTDTIISQMDAVNTFLISITPLAFVTSTQHLNLINTTFWGMNLECGLFDGGGLLSGSMKQVTVANTTHTATLFHFSDLSSFVFDDVLFYNVILLTPLISFIDFFATTPFEISASKFTCTNVSLETSQNTLETTTLFVIDVTEKRQDDEFSLSEITFTASPFSAAMNILHLRVDTIDTDLISTLSLTFSPEITDLFTLTDKEGSHNLRDALFNTASTIFVDSTFKDESRCGSLELPCLTLMEGLNHRIQQHTTIEFRTDVYCDLLVIEAPLTLRGERSLTMNVSSPGLVVSEPHFTVKAKTELNSMILDYTQSKSRLLFNIISTSLDLSFVTLSASGVVSKTLFNVDRGSISLTSIVLDDQFHDIGNLFNVNSTAAVTLRWFEMNDRELSRDMLDMPTPGSDLQMEGIQIIRPEFVSSLGSLVDMVGGTVDLVSCVISKSHSPWTSDKGSPIRMCHLSQMRSLFTLQGCVLTMKRCCLTELFQTPLNLVSVTATLIQSVLEENSPGGEQFPSFRSNIVCSGTSSLLLIDPMTDDAVLPLWITQADDCTVRSNQNKIGSRFDQPSDETRAVVQTFDVGDIETFKVDSPFAHPHLTNSTLDGDKLSIAGSYLMPCSLKVVLHSRASSETRSAVTPAAATSRVEYECGNVTSVNESYIECIVPKSIVSSNNFQWRVAVRVSTGFSKEQTSNDIVAIHQQFKKTTSAETVWTAVAAVLIGVLSLATAVFVVLLVLTTTQRARWHQKQNYLFQQRINNLAASSVTTDFSRRSSVSSMASRRRSRAGSKWLSRKPSFSSIDSKRSGSVQIKEPQRRLHSQESRGPSSASRRPELQHRSDRPRSHRSHGSSHSSHSMHRQGSHHPDFQRRFNSEGSRVHANFE
ncbi:hypothetical protein BLNAU_10619 [Blattamonas nauphoetae]|uniref:Transmembrane protein n=1 Tax=Blattamonas nauphoetae TaxID=2049346 RepID=A0ABQ9XQQ7_9EUKA|nr:hypothetical protein BLNAU_10619 [Blattamonas nauphoetae]